MAHLVVDGDDLVVALSPMEKLGAFRGNLRVPRTSVTSCRVCDDLWSEVRGVKLAGTGIPGRIVLGTRVGKGFRDFFAIRRQDPGVVIELNGTGFDRLVVTVTSPEETAATLNRGPGGAVA